MSGLGQGSTAEVDAMKLKFEKSLEDYNYWWREIDELWHEMARKTGLSDSAFEILYCILELGEGCLQKDLCDINSMSKQTVHSAVKKLERDGLIESGNENGRDKRVYLTPMGKAFTREKILPFAEMENAVFAEMSDEESRELIRLTRKYQEEFRKKLREKNIL